MITGSLVAITTPMFDDGSLDFDSYRKLIDWHIEKGTNGIVAVGTTGESPTVDVDEICGGVIAKTAPRPPTVPPAIRKIRFIVSSPYSEWKANR
jgi:4-hydroxy-tetrahydrodipicolinate synthase